MTGNRSVCRPQGRQRLCACSGPQPDPYSGLPTQDGSGRERRSGKRCWELCEGFAGSQLHTRCPRRRPVSPGVFERLSHVAVIVQSLLVCADSNRCVRSTNE